MVSRTCRHHDAAALAWAQVGANCAWYHPGGVLRSEPIEAALDTMAARTLQRHGVRPTTRQLGARRVLHVLSETHEAGGHTRLAAAWVELDDASTSAVALLRPVSAASPITSIAATTGAPVHHLGHLPPLDRAGALRALARCHDVVVAHTHPDDPVPALSFGAGFDGPPVVMMNHADHAFWITPGYPTLLVHTAAKGVLLTTEARGFPPDRCAVLPIPVLLAGRRVPRAQARRSLGLSATQVLAVTIAWPGKYRATAVHPSFTDVVGRALAARPELILIAVGPAPSDEGWRELVERFPDRVRPVGVDPDPSTYLDAADVYLNSFPWSSSTSVLEAASRDVPVLSSRRYTGLREGLCGVDPEVGPTEWTASTTDEYVRVLTSLVDDPAVRRTSGKRTGEAYRESRNPQRWRSLLEERVYFPLEALTPIDPATCPPGPYRPELADYAVAALGLGGDVPVARALAQVRPQLHWADRAWVRATTPADRAARRWTAGLPSGWLGPPPWARVTPCRNDSPRR